jgi:hypothetical protein
LPIFEHAGDLHRPFAARCRPLRACSSASSWAAEGEAAPPQGRAAAQPFGGGRRPEHRLEAGQDRQLLRERGAHGRDRFRNGRVVLHGLVRRGRALGVLVRDPEGAFKTRALLCSDLKADPQKVVSCFIMRGQLEVTFQEARRHLGFETQRQCSDMAIRRTTPALLALFSLVALLVDRPMRQAAGTFRRRAGWYHTRPISDLRRRARVGAQRAVGPGADFIRVARVQRHDKSPAGLRGTPNGGGLLCTLMAKVELPEGG